MTHRLYLREEARKVAALRIIMGSEQLNRLGFCGEKPITTPVLIPHVAHLISFWAWQLNSLSMGRNGSSLIMMEKGAAQ